MSETASRREVVELRDASEVAHEAAERFVKHAEEAVADHNEFRVALSGGSTPKLLYAVLAKPPYRERVAWDKTQVFFSDERFVPPDSEESNYHTAQTGLLSQVPIPKRSIHSVPTVDVSPDAAAELYEQGIRRVFHAGDTEIPRFDLVFLGMGPDGHTASLFPETDALTVTDRLVAPNYIPRLDAWRITFTYPLLNAAQNVLFLVAGTDKADALRDVLGGSSELPSARVAPLGGRLAWLVDSAACRGTR